MTHQVGAPLHFGIGSRGCLRLVAVFVIALGCGPARASGLDLRNLELLGDLTRTHLERGEPGESAFDVRLDDSSGWSCSSI